MLPHSLDILSRTVMIPTDPSHNINQINSIIKFIEIATKYAFGFISKNKSKIKTYGKLKW